MKEKRNIIRTDKYGNVVMPKDITEVWMNEAKLLDLFGVTALTIRTGIKALYNGMVLREFEIRRTIRISDNCSMEVYNLETIVAPRFPYRHIRSGTGT